jgi:glycosyltransferase involved in cell wall biosynthesis
MSVPRVSVCVDVYNYGRFLPEAVESVLSQDMTNFEIVVVDDCSQDDSFAIARDFAARDSRVKAHQNPANLGMVGNRNACLRLARGEYVKILHADDFLSTPDALRKMTQFLDENPGMSLAASGLSLAGAGTPPRPLRTCFPDRKAVSGTGVIARCLAARRNLIGPPSATMFRRDRASRGFDETFFHSADWEMWFHLLEHGCFGFLDEALTTYRLHEDQQTEKDKETLTRCKDTLGLLDRYLDRPYNRFPKVLRGLLRHVAMADFVRQSRRLGLPAGDAFLRQQGRLAFHARGPFYFLYDRCLRPAAPARRRPRETTRQLEKFSPGINVAGFFKGEYGIGDSSRAFSQLIRDSGLPAVFLNIHSREHRNLDASFGPYATRNPHSVNLMTFSADYARRFHRDRGAGFVRHRHNIAIWFWELEKFPARWHSCFDYYDEIWVSTTFCQRSIAEVSPIPVIPIGFPFAIEPAPVANRESLGVNPGTFLFLFNFDFHSVVERKNPEGVIAAFRRAFGGGKENVALVLKSINARHHPEAAARLRAMAEGLNVLWKDEHLTGTEMKQLFSAADCYVSLHRSEGLGLGMARAMSYGKPVIATGYSGNLDFTTPENSLLVRYRLVELERDYGGYEKGGFWAEPDIDHAAAQMRRVFENPGEAQTLGEKARADLTTRLNPASVLANIRRRLDAADPRFRSL